MAHSHPAGEGMYYGAGGGSEAAWQAGLRAAEGPPTPPRARRVAVEVTRHEVTRSPIKAYSAEATPERAFEPQPLQREVCSCSPVPVPHACLAASPPPPPGAPPRPGNGTARQEIDNGPPVSPVLAPLWPALRVRIHAQALPPPDYGHRGPPCQICGEVAQRGGHGAAAPEPAAEPAHQSAL